MSVIIARMASLTESSLIPAGAGLCTGAGAGAAARAGAAAVAGAGLAGAAATPAPTGSFTGAGVLTPAVFLSFTLRVLNTISSSAAGSPETSFTQLLYRAWSEKRLSPAFQTRSVMDMAMCEPKPAAKRSAYFRS